MKTHGNGLVQQLGLIELQVLQVASLRCVYYFNGSHFLHVLERDGKQQRPWISTTHRGNAYQSLDVALAVANQIPQIHRGLGPRRLGLLWLG